MTATMRDSEQLRLTFDLLKEVLGGLGTMVPIPPALLHHYTSLEVIEKMVGSDDLRLSHVEYSNDQRELKEAIDLIRAQLSAPPLSASAFYAQVSIDFEAKISAVDVYVFCTCAGEDDGSADLLSQWRAYGHDGRGGAITLRKRKLDTIARFIPGLRINPVFYDVMAQTALVQGILTSGLALYPSNPTGALYATVDALVYCLPLMKHAGFSEEREWRLIYLPVTVGTLPTLHFHPRRDFLAPFIELRDLWDKVGPTQSPLESGLGPRPDLSPLLPVDQVTVGPSIHQDLNVRAVEKVLVQHKCSATVARSATPYRSVG